MDQSSKDFDLTDKTAVVTGGGTGLGYHIARALAESGAQVMIGGRRTEVLKEAAEKLMSEPLIDSVLYESVDLSDRNSVKAFAKQALAKLSRVDIFVGNAGGTEESEFIEDISDEVMDKQLRVNLVSNIELTREFLPGMRGNKWGRVIFSSSVAAERGAMTHGSSIYGTSKAGLNAFAKYIAAEAGLDGVTANSLLLGPFLTEVLQHFFDRQEEEVRDAVIKGLTCMTATDRMGKTEEVEGIIKLLASDAGSYITGAVIPVDGGMSATFTPRVYD